MAWMKASLFSIVAVGLAACSSTGTAQNARSDRGAQFFERMDTDGDGLATFAEIRAMRAAMFDRMDEDGDGSLTIDEAQSAQRQMRQGGSQRGNAGRGRGGGQGVAGMDADGDGRITRDEFAANLGMIARLDQDGDQAISRAEFSAAMERMRQRRR